MAHIFVAEDEEILRAAICSVLRKEGHTVNEAGNGAEALEAMRGLTVDLLLTDVLMPVMDGRRLVSALAARGQSMKVLYMSGYHTEDLRKDGMSEGTPHLMEKPFRMNALVAKIRSLLAHP